MLPFYDKTSGLICVQNQVSLGADKTVIGKTAFKDWIWHQVSVLSKHYHGDKGVFSSQAYRDDCVAKQQ